MNLLFASNLLVDTSIVSIIIVAVGAVVIIATILSYYFLTRRKKKDEAVEEPVAEEPAEEGEAAVADEPSASVAEPAGQLVYAEPEPQPEQRETVEEVIWVEEKVEEEPVEEPAPAKKKKASKKPAEVVIVEEVEEPVEEPAKEEPAEAQAEPAPAEESAAEEADDDYWVSDPELLYDDEEDFVDEPESADERAEEAEEEKEEAPATVRVAEGEGDDVHYVIKKYQKGFMAKLIQSEDIVKKYYTEIKNELLSYEGIKSREAWNHESFSAGRTMIAKIGLRGKTLALYVALDPKQVIAEGRYAVDDLSGVATHASTPTLYRIKNNRRLGGSKQLIKSAMKGHVQNEKYRPINWMRRIPYEDNEALAEKGLVKVTVEEEK